MNIRTQISMVFHLDKCIGCHTCSISCKNIWTDRKGTEYMWWNNVETKPGTGYPTLWEDQQKYKGGWILKNKKIKLNLQSKLGALKNIFFNPFLPTIEDYYEPWTYRYEDLFSPGQEEDQPTAKPISMITGKEIDIQAGPNWDDDLGGSPVYAANDPNLAALSEEEKKLLFEMERMVFFYLPRICNHCLNPGCLAACPAGAIYKRGEDGIVLISQDKCRGWRMCVSGCPYKKVYYNWAAGKSEKCILCFPRLETGQAPACFHSCVGRIRYLGVLLYDADRIVEAAVQPMDKLVQSQREIILDPFDSSVIAEAKAQGIPPSIIEAAQKSPVYKFVKQFKIALPLHPEFRTLPMLFYVPPLLPVLATFSNGTYKIAEDMMSSLESSRLPVQFMASLFSAGNKNIIAEVYKKLIAVRIYMRAKSVGDINSDEVKRALNDGKTDEREVEEIFRLTSLSTFADRFVIPPLFREVSIEGFEDPYNYKREIGFGSIQRPKRKW